MTIQIIGRSRQLLCCVFFSALLFCLPLCASAQTATSVECLVKVMSKNTLEVETKATPYKLTGDFDGDKIEDVAVVVKLSDTVKNIENAVTVEYPYAFGKDVDTDILALFIIHGKNKGWQVAQKSSVLLLGRNSALVFEKSRLNETGEAMRIQKKKGGKDSLYLITEGADGTIRWNGKKYVWTESQP